MFWNHLSDQEKKSSRSLCLVWVSLKIEIPAAKMLLSRSPVMESETQIYRGGWIYSCMLIYLFKAFFQILIYSIIMIGFILTYWEKIRHMAKMAWL